MNFTQSNFFNLEQPEEWVCRLWSYGAGHSEMEIIVRRQSVVQKIGFVGVEYFDGPTDWKGANFELGSSEDTLMFLRRVTSLTEFSDESLLETSKLFSVAVQDSNVPGLRVNIVAAVGVLVDYDGFP